MSRRHLVWTPAQDKSLLALRAAGNNIAQLATALGRGKGSISSRLQDLGMGSPPAPAPTAKARPCLCCGKRFNSTGPGNRLCQKCRHKDVSPFATC